MSDRSLYVKPDIARYALAHTTGADDWTTLPERGGATSRAVPSECGAGFLVNEHPWLKHYLTIADNDCTATGTSGSWNSLTGASNGWQQVNFDLSAYAGKSVEVSVKCAPIGRRSIRTCIRIRCAIS